MRRFLFFLVLALPALAGAQWVADVLGDGYEMRYVDQGRDYSGPVRSTVVRKHARCPESRKGVLYVHGYSDYFFQKEMGDRFADSCFNFYAVDLRKYGRSLMDGQTRFQARNLNEYYADIDSALAVMRADGIDEVVLVGHSTGGLITSLFMKEKPDTIVKALVLNSPFLEWNLGSGMRSLAIPAVASLGYWAPNVQISNGNSTAYAESLLSDHHGEWQFNTDWKPLYPDKVQSGWIKAIDEGHDRLRKGKPILVPILLMHSDNSVYGDTWTEAFQHGDAVLNVDDISRYGRQLGPVVTEATVHGALHDLVLSEQPVREATYRTIFDWLDRKAGL